MSYPDDGPMAFPVITLEMRGMKHAIRTALTERNVQIDAHVQASLDKLCSPENVSRIVFDNVRDELEGAIKRSVSDFFTSGEGYDAINDAVRERLIKTILGR